MLATTRLTALALTIALAPLAASAQDSLNIRLVGRTADLNRGTITRVQVVDNTAYTLSNSATAINITDPANPSRIGEIGVSDGSYRVGLAVGNNLVHTTSRNQGYRVTDFSDQAHPAELFQAGFYIDFADHGRDVVLYQNYAYVLTSGHLLYIFDLDDPNRIQMVGDRLALNYDGVTMSMALAGDYILVAGVGALKVVSLEHPLQPSLVASVDLDGMQGNKVVVAGNTAYVAELDNWGSPSQTDIKVFDISDMVHPRQIGLIDQLPIAQGWNYPVDIVPVDSFLIVSSGGALGTIDITDLAHPRTAWMIPPDYAYSLALRGDLLYVGGLHRLSIYDIAGALGHQQLNIPEEDRSHEFGNVRIGHEETWELDVRNEGGWQLGVSGLSLSDATSYSIEYVPERWRLNDALDIRRGLDDRISGVELVGDDLYITGGNGGNGNPMVYVCQKDGGLIRSFAQPVDGAWGIRDLAWDGRSLWGADGSEIVSFDLEGNRLSRINRPMRFVAWDPGEQLIWATDYNSQILALSRDGRVVHTLDHPGDLRIYGLGWDDEAEDSWNLILYASYDGHPTALLSLNTETGQTRELNVDLATTVPNARAAGSITITDDWDPPARHVIGTVDGDWDQVCVWQMTDFYTGGSFNVNPQSAVPLTVHFRPDRAEALPCDLTIHSDDGNEPEVTIHLTGAGVENNPPEWTQRPPAHVDVWEQELCTFGFNATDRDNDPVNFELIYNDLPREASFADNHDGSGILSWTPADWYIFQTFHPQIVATDGINSDTADVEIQVWETSVQRREDGLPLQFNLSTPYPNPFNSTAQVSFDLPQASAIELSVLDLSGRKALNLAQGLRPAGRYRAVIDGSGLASGTYLVRLHAGNYVNTRKMLLLR